MRTVSLMTANQEFSKLVREVERGEGFLITRSGRPIAKLVPHNAGMAADPEWAAAHRRMMVRLGEGASLGGLRIERDGLHDRKGGALPSTPTFRSVRSTAMPASGGGPQ